MAVKPGEGRGLRALALVDGEHYPDVTAGALHYIENELGYTLVAIGFLGGSEKISDLARLSYRGLPVYSGTDQVDVLRRAVSQNSTQIILDLSDEPILGYRQRFRLISEALAMGVSYRGADFTFEAPVRPFACPKPSIGIWGTGKRVGKTAVAGFAARHLKSGGTTTCICTMGRGGPPDPELLDMPEAITDEYLQERAESGRHAASDHFEDAMMAGVTTVGCRRCGGGMAGEPFYSNTARGAELACAQPADMLLFEGSGTAVPAVGTDAVILVAGATRDEEDVLGYLGPYRLLLSDLLVVTMCEEFLISSERLRRLTDGVQSINPGIKVVKTVFRPRPLDDLNGRKVYITSTAPPEVAKSQAEHLKSQRGAYVVGISWHLADRAKLVRDLESALKADVLVTELKAAGVDTVSRFAKKNDKELVYLENEPVSLDGESLEDEIDHLAAIARDRADGR